MSHLLHDASMLEIFVSLAIVYAALSITVLALVVFLPPLYQEAKTWFPKRKVIDFQARRRELAQSALAGETRRASSKIGAAGYPHRRVH